MNVNRRSIRTSGALAGALLLGACASTDRVVFVTDTELGVGYDATAAKVNIGYDRNELVIGPAYPDTGGIPPVYARLQSNASVFSPEVRQLYATGDASTIVTAKNPRAALASVRKHDENDPKSLTGNRRLMVFGTTSNVGLKVSFASGAATGLPSAVSFGFKRQEFSIIPLRRDGERESGEDEYGSVIAAIDITSNAGTPEDTFLGIHQFFATGEAAENMAADEGVSRSFKTAAREAAEAAKTIPALSTQENSKLAVICGYRAERKTDSEVEQKVSAAEAATAETLDTFCNADAGHQRENLDRWCKALGDQGLTCTRTS